MDWNPIILTLELATVTTVLLVLTGVPLAWWMSQSRSKSIPLLEAVFSMPLVLPPSVIGFYLLIAFSPQSGIGSFLSQSLGLQLAFSFEGLVLASVIYSFPFMINPLLSGFRSIPVNLLETSSLLGMRPIATLWRVALPCITPSLVSALVLSFAHTLGEFGVVLMIGGNIPGETRVASIAIFDSVEAMRYSDANAYSLVLILLSLTLLTALHVVMHIQRKS